MHKHICSINKFICSINSSLYKHRSLPYNSSLCHGNEFVTGVGLSLSVKLLVRQKRLEITSNKTNYSRFSYSLMGANIDSLLNSLNSKCCMVELVFF